MAKSSHQTIWKSLSPLFPELPNGLYFPATGYCFVIGERDYDKEIPGKEYHYVNMKRFFDTDKIRQNRQKIRFGQKCMKMLENGAACAFSDAAKEHENLERYYIEAMDFEKLQSVKNEIFRLFTKPL